MCEMPIGQPDGVAKSAPSLSNATPGVLLWPAAIIAWGPGYASDMHKHHSAQLVIAIEGRLWIRGKSNHQWAECGAALVKPDATHEVDASGAQVLIVLVDPESDLGAALTDKVTQDITLISEDTVARWREQLGDWASLTSAKVESLVQRSLLSSRRKPRLHPKLYRALEVIREDLGNNRRLSLKRLAAVAELSESRFMHVFTRSIGVPPRSYILWLRFQLACDELRRGATPTQAAHRAGFADAAHMSRTVRRMMGTTPVDLVQRRPAWGTVFTGDASAITENGGSRPPSAA
jgi:AraC-like DNA-binding protein